MTDTNEIIRMAREAGVIGGFDEVHPSIERFYQTAFEAGAAHEAEKWKAANKRDYENWKMAAEKAAECEREACAKVCEDIIASVITKPMPLRDIVAAIRARSEK